MEIVKATENNSEELKAFFQQQVVKGSINYRVERTDSFFLQYRLVTEDYSTYMIKDNSGDIAGLSSILFRKGYVNHQEQNIGYLTDLRVKQGSDINWTETMAPVFQREMEERNSQYLFSDLEQYENQMYQTLLRARNRGSHHIRYHLMRKFFLVMLFGRKFWRDEPLRSIKIEMGQTEDIEAICQYLKSKSVGKPLSFNLTPEELERRFRIWPHFSIQNFILARNNLGDIIGCMAPWNNKHVQQWIAHKYHGKSFQVYSTAKTLSSFGLLRPFPNEGSPFQLKFITHMAADNPDIFYSLLDQAYTQCRNNELIFYPNYMGDYQTRPPRAFFSVKMPFGFYTLLDDSKKLPIYLQPNPFTPPPDFPFVHF